MNILFVANFHAPLDGGVRGRFVYLGEMLCQRGHQVELVVSDFYHDTKLPREVDYTSYQTKITVLHEPPYSRNVSLGRLRSHWAFGKNVERYVSTLQDIDCIYCAMPALSSTYRIARIAKRRGIKFVVDVQDVWPEAFQMLMPHKALRYLFYPMQWMANQCYSTADLILGVSRTYVDRALSANHKGAKGLDVFLGNDSHYYDKNNSSIHLQRQRNEVLMVYIGSMGASYDLSRVFRALGLVKNRKCLSIPLRFILMGGGEQEGKLQKMAKHIFPNTVFMGRKPFSEMAALLQDCDFAINPIVKGSMQSIINKVGDYALAGLPVINTQECQEYRNLIDQYQCGINCRCENIEDMATAIERLAMDKTLRKQMATQSLRLGHERFDRQVTYTKIIKELENLYNNQG